MYNLIKYIDTAKFCGRNQMCIGKYTQFLLSNRQERWINKEVSVQISVQANNIFCIILQIKKILSFSTIYQLLN